MKTASPNSARAGTRTLFQLGSRTGPLLLAFAVSASGYAMAAPRETFTISQGFALVMSGKQVLTFNGDPALEKQIESITHMPSTVVVTVRKIADLPQKGCKRIGMDLTAPQAVKPDLKGKPVVFATNMAMNLCPGGLPPRLAGLQ